MTHTQYLPRRESMWLDWLWIYIILSMLLWRLDVVVEVQLRKTVVMSFRIGPQHHIKPIHPYNPDFKSVLLFASETSMSLSRSTDVFVPPTSIEECIHWINRYCDRALLHAVIASDYRFLYRGISINTPNAAISLHVDGSNNFKALQRTVTGTVLPLQTTIQSDVPDLLQIETYGEDGVRFFQRLENMLQNESIRPSIGHLATTVSMDAAIWGNYSASIWPLSMHAPEMSMQLPPTITSSIDTVTTASQISYAWFCNGGMFYPRTSHGDELQRSMMAIVNGSCEPTNNHHNYCNDSLVDALQYQNGFEIMLTASIYLAVPSRYDYVLRDHLRKSFLI
jgi:hypothetical protein